MLKFISCTPIWILYAVLIRWCCDYPWDFRSISTAVNKQKTFRQKSQNQSLPDRTPIFGSSYVFYICDAFCSHAVLIARHIYIQWGLWFPFSSIRHQISASQTLELSLKVAANFDCCNLYHCAGILKQKMTTKKLAHSIIYRHGALQSTVTR